MEKDRWEKSAEITLSFLPIVLTVMLFVVGIVAAVETQPYCHYENGTTITMSSTGCPSGTTFQQSKIVTFNTVFSNKLFWILVGFLISWILLIITYQIDRKNNYYSKIKTFTLFLSIMATLCSFNYGAYQITYYYSPALKNSYFVDFWYISLVISVIIILVLLVPLICQFFYEQRKIRRCND